MLKQLLYFYYKWKIYKAVKRKIWYSRPRILNFNESISSVLHKINCGIMANFLFSFKQKDNLLKYCFKKIVHLKSDKKIVKELIINFTDNYTDYVISWFKLRLSIVQLPIVREAISSSVNANQYVLDCFLNSDADNALEDKPNLILGAKNSIPIEIW